MQTVGQIWCRTDFTNHQKLNRSSFSALASFIISTIKRPMSRDESLHPLPLELRLEKLVPRIYFRIFRIKETRLLYICFPPKPSPRSNQTGWAFWIFQRKDCLATIGRPKGRLKEEGVWGAGAPHPLIDAKAETPGCLKVARRPKNAPRPIEIHVFVFNNAVTRSYQAVTYARCDHEVLFLN